MLVLARNCNLSAARGRKCEANLRRWFAPRERPFGSLTKKVATRFTVKKFEKSPIRSNRWPRDMPTKV